MVHNMFYPHRLCMVCYFFPIFFPEWCTISTKYIQKIKLKKNQAEHLPENGANLYGCSRIEYVRISLKSYLFSIFIQLRIQIWIASDTNTDVFGCKY
jgi:hypothetical protein